MYIVFILPEIFQGNFLRQKMLSKTEQGFLNNPANFNSNYQRSLLHSLKVKAENA
jgi:hypothetical protein